MSLTTTETLGFSEGLIAFMTSNQAALAAAGLTVGPFITELGSQKSDAVTKNEQQEALKAQLRMKTEETTTAFGTLYDNASTKLDAIIGVLGKTSELAKHAAKLRSAIRRGSGSAAPTPPST
jgi:hypothetical protein